jgi:predicted 2-oxoglutarate/Fe(II)-dependent dioxygenase YbiX
MDELIALAGAPVGAAPPTPTPRKQTAAERVEALLLVDGGLVRINRLLPRKAARAAHELLASLPERTWHRATRAVDAARGERGAGSTAHAYSVGDGSEDAAREAAVAALLEDVAAAAAPFCAARGLVAKLQLARYGKGDYIEPHDDAAETTIDGARMARVLALVWYATGDETPWDAAAHGGEFVDRATGAAYAPSHNSLVAFRVPWLHEVRPPTSDRLRYSVFGWLYAPAGGAPRGGGGGAAPRKKRKRKRGKAPS